MRARFEGYIDKAPNDLFAGEGEKEGHAGGWFTLNTDPSSEMSSPFNVTKRYVLSIWVAHICTNAVSALENLIF